jgi:hypothetical protein
LRRPAAGKALPDASSLKYFLQTYKQGTDSLNLLFTFLTGEKSALVLLFGGKSECEGKSPKYPNERFVLLKHRPDYTLKTLGHGGAVSQQNFSLDFSNPYRPCRQVAWQEPYSPQGCL